MGEENGRKRKERKRSLFSLLPSPSLLPALSKYIRTAN
jgi:hypothetical protein